MKRPLLLMTAAACAASGAASSLRGDGVEEVGEQIEHFPPEDYYDSRGADRRDLLLAAAEEEGLGGRALSESDGDGSDGDDEGAYHDEWPDEDILGHVVEDEDRIYVEEWRGGDEDEDEAFEYGDGGGGPIGIDLDGWPEEDAWPEEDVVVVKGGIEGEDDSSDGGSAPPAEKEYVRDPNSETIVGTDLMGEAVADQYDRREAACTSNKSEFKILLQTDNYGYETEWKLVNVQTNNALAAGPPPNRNYADKSTYSGRWCLSPGQYQFRLYDSGGDGICNENPAFGCGSLRLFLNGQNAGRMINDKSSFRQKNFPFVVGISSRIDGTPSKPSNPNLGEWCSKVASRIKVPQGKCTLPDGRKGHRVRVTTKVDKYGKETSWQIKEASGNVVKMKMGPVVESNSAKSVEQCLPPGRYTLRFQDIDGICCRHGQGFFKLKVDGQDLLNGGKFTRSVEHDFQLGFDWIKGMKERDCEWWWAHDYRRRDWHTRCYKGQYCNKTYRHLKWSPALKADAADYARRLLNTCAENGIKHDKTDQGENLAKNRGSGAWGALYPADKVTKRFVDNEEFWGWNANAHLTQAMWYSTRYIGCAESVKNMGGGKMCRFQVCRYAKAGNCMMGQYNSENGNNWMTPMMMDDSPCGPMCASRDGCFN